MKEDLTQQRSVEEERRAYAEEFAKAITTQIVHDPSGKTSRRATRTFSNYTRENVESWLSNPTANEKNLRDASVFLYNTNIRYSNLLNYYANLPCWYYTIEPINFNKEKVKKESFVKQYQKVCSIVRSMNISKTMRIASLIALREGVMYGAIWGGDGNSFILQVLNPDYCQITKIIDGNVFQFAYDMSKVKEEDLDSYYPPQFKEMYQAYRSTGNQYQEVPKEISFCLKGDPSIVNYSFPAFSSILPTLYAIKNIEDITENTTELSNYKMISGEIPTASDGTPLMTYETAMKYYAHIANNVGENVGVAISPFKLKNFDFEQSGATAQIDNVARANENFFAAAGTTPVLHGTSNPTSGVTKLAIKPDEAVALSLMNSCFDNINAFLKLLPGTVKFKLAPIPATIFNKDEMLDKYKNALNFGIGKLQYAACLGIAQHSIQGQIYIENEVLGIDSLFTVMKTAATQTKDDVSAGRPEEDDLTESGESSRDNDVNSNR